MRTYATIREWSLPSRKILNILSSTDVAGPRTSELGGILTNPAAYKCPTVGT